MAYLSRANVRTACVRLADAYGSPRWDTTMGATGEVDQHLGTAHAKWWRRILDACRSYRVGVRTPTSDADGRYALADLSSGTAGLATRERFHRVLSVLIDRGEYEDATQESERMLLRWSLLAAGETEAGPRTYWVAGDYLYTLPKLASTQATAIWVNHTPERLDALSDDTYDVVFPEDWYHVLFHEGAANLLMKGGAETQAAAELRQQAEAHAREMIGELTRRSTGPLVMRFPDGAADWAG